jgi:hypothetical protein
MGTELELGDKSLVQLIDLKELFKSYNLTAKIKTIGLRVPKFESLRTHILLNGRLLPIKRKNLSLTLKFSKC